MDRITQYRIQIKNMLYSTIYRCKETKALQHTDYRVPIFQPARNMGTSALLRDKRSDTA